jgi:hypothetical protein
MRNIGTKIVLFILTLAMAKGALAQANKTFSSKQSDSESSIKQTNAILISKYMILNGNEALLIRDSSKIKELVSLFSGNETVGHACAYHWLIWFRQNPTTAVPFSHNEDCEVYQANNTKINSLLKTYFSIIKNSPSHFIYNLKVPASLEPEEAVRKLENNSHFVFFFRGTEERLPHIKIQATTRSEIPKDRTKWNIAKSKNLDLGQGKLKEAIDALGRRYAIIKSTKLDNRYSSFGGGIIEDRVVAIIYFQYGTALDNIENVLNEVDVLEKKIPTNYMLQLVAEERFSDKFRRRLMSNHQFLLDVFPFPDLR